jgi:hypothetical protein
MRLVRLAVKVLLALITFCEALAALELWMHGPPMETGATAEQSFKTAQPSASDWTILVAMVALQVALVVFLWWSRRKIAGSGWWPWSP